MLVLTSQTYNMEAIMDTIDEVVMNATDFAATRYPDDQTMRRGFLQYIHTVVGLDVLANRDTEDWWEWYATDHDDTFIGEYADFTTFVQEIVNVSVKNPLPFDIFDSIDYDEVADRAEELYATALSEDGIYIWEAR